MSFPSVLLMEGNGAPYAKIVGATRTPEEYLKKLEAAGETRRKLKETVAAAQPLKGKEKLEQLVKALNVLPEDLQPFQKGLIAEISALDPEDRYGFAKKSEKAAAMEKQRLMWEQFCQKYSGKLSAEETRASREEALQMLEKKDTLPPIRLKIAKYISDGYTLERNLPKALEYLEIARDADPSLKPPKNWNRGLQYAETYQSGEQKLFLKGMAPSPSTEDYYAFFRFFILNKKQARLWLMKEPECMMRNEYAGLRQE